MSYNYQACVFVFVVSGVYSFVDLFCGIGGFHIALEAKGLTCVLAADVDLRARNVYKDNFGIEPRGDIRDICEKSIPPHDILCAGFPCQSFSIAGKREGVKNSNGRLFYEILRIADHCQPRIILLENVKNILTIDGGRVIRMIHRQLNNIGYRVYKYTLNSSFFGVPQSRERVYFVCVRKNLISDGAIKVCRPKETNSEVFLDSVIDEDVCGSLYVRRSDVVLRESSQKYQLRPIRLGHVNKGGQGERIYSIYGHAITLSAYGGGAGARTGLYCVNDGVRRLSVDECKLVMGFSRDHIVSCGWSGYEQLGNAVIPRMVGSVYDAISIL